jgi:hypothetical protein
MKNCDNAVREYVRRLSEDDLRFLNSRLGQQLFGDRAEASGFLSQNREIDRWLSSAVTATEFFDGLDLVAEYVEKECARRFDKR